MNPKVADLERKIRRGRIIIAVSYGVAVAAIVFSIVWQLLNQIC